MFLLSAHFFRAGYGALVFLTLIFPFLLLIRRPWAAHTMQIVLILGGIEWIRTLASLALIRQSIGAPWFRLALILGGVAFLTICSACVFRFSALRSRYDLRSKQKALS
jgi:hypothetical protein